jgi:hypothetical protein
MSFFIEMPFGISEMVVLFGFVMDQTAVHNTGSGA